MSVREPYEDKGAALGSQRRSSTIYIVGNESTMTMSHHWEMMLCAQLS